GDRVRGEVIQKLIKEYTDKALDEQHLRPLLAPEIVTEETDLAKSLRFSATFDLRPELVVRDYAGLKVPRPEVQVTDEQVQKALEELRERHATLKKIDDRTRAQRGDFALVEIEGFVEGKPLEGARTGQRLVELSPERLAHGLDEERIGAEAGRPAQATRRSPADYAEKERAGSPRVACAGRPTSAPMSSASSPWARRSGESSTRRWPVRAPSSGLPSTKPSISTSAKSPRWARVRSSIFLSVAWRSRSSSSAFCTCSSVT